MLTEDEPEEHKKEEEVESKFRSSSATAALMDHVRNASSLNRRASSSTIPDASAERVVRSYIFTISGDGGGDRGVASRCDTVERGRVRPNKEPDILRRRPTIDADFESAEDDVGPSVDPLSLVRRE